MALNRFDLVFNNGSERTSKEHMRNILVQSMKDNIGSIYIDTSEEKFLYSLFYTHAKKNDKLNDFYCLNLLAHTKDEKVSHTLDPINPLIPFKEQFLNLFNLSEAVFDELFYSLIKECYEQNIAVDSTVISSLVSLKTLISCDNNILIPVLTKYKVDVKRYLDFLGLKDEDKVENLLEENHDAINLHHNTVKNIVYINNIIKHYESIGVFSINPQIDFNQIIKQSKVLLVLLPNVTKNKDVKHLYNIILTQLLTIENDVLNNLDNSLDIKNNENRGFLSVQMLDDVSYLLNDDTLKLFTNLLERKNSRKIFTCIASTNYSNLLNNFNLAQPQVDYFLDLFNQHYFLYQKNETNSIPSIVKEKILTNCESFDNIFYKNSLNLQNLTVDSFYHYVEEFVKINNKYVSKGLLRKINFYAINYMLDDNITWLNRPVIRK